MRWYALVLLALGACGASDASPAPVGSPGPTASTPAPAAPTAASSAPSASGIVGAPDFSIVIRDYNWEAGGSEVFIAKASGEATRVFYTGRMEQDPRYGQVLASHFFRLDRTLSADELLELQRAIENAAFFDLAHEHIDRGVADGAMTSLRVTARGRTHEVRCSNQYPDAIVQLMRHVNQRLVPAFGNAETHELDRAAMHELGADGW